MKNFNYINYKVKIINIFNNIKLNFSEIIDIFCPCFTKTKKITNNEFEGFVYVDHTNFNSKFNDIL